MITRAEPLRALLDAFKHDAWSEQERARRHKMLRAVEAALTASSSQVVACDVCEMGLPEHLEWRSKSGRPVQVICNACLEAQRTAMAGGLSLGMDASQGFTRVGETFSRPRSEMTAEERAERDGQS